MTQSPKLRFFSGFNNSSSNNKQPATSNTENNTDNNSDIKTDSNHVQGWLMNIHACRDPEDLSEIVPTATDATTATIIVDENNNSIPLQSSRQNNKKGRPESIASEESVNLDELINANFTVDMDDETDLPDLADLEIDDSTDEFWKLNGNDTGFNEFMSKSTDELDWSPSTTEKTTTNLPLKTMRTTAITSSTRYRRSDSFSSENSLNSQSTVTQYAKYGLTPMIYPSESTSTSSRSLSRQSNYSNTSSNTTSGIPQPVNSNIPTPSRSFTTKTHSALPSPQQQRTSLAKRASHIPALSSSSKNNNTKNSSKSLYYSPPSPQRTISSSSTCSNNNSSSSPNKILKKSSITGSNSREYTSATATKPPSQHNNRIPQRASHIPTSRDSMHRPGSPLNYDYNQTRSGSITPSRIGLRSPTPGSEPRNSIFASSKSNSRTISAEEKNTSNNSNKSPGSTRTSGLRPPSSAGTSSRIGTLKKPTSFSSFSS